MVLFTSDFHLQHNHILQFENRGFSSLSQMEAALIQQWNEQVFPSDVVYFLGDFSFGNAAEIRSEISQLNGRVVLIRGNHDLHSCEWYVNHGFAACYDRLEVELHDRTYLLSHYPRRPTPEQYERYALTDPGLHRFYDRHPETDMPIIHGHVHHRWAVDAEHQQVNVGWDAWHRLVSASEIEEALEVV